MSKWKTKTIGELCDIGGGKVKTGPFGSQLHQSDYAIEGTPVIMPADIKPNGVDTNRIARVNQSHVDRLCMHKLSVGDIVYGRRGDIGRQAIISKNEKGWLCGTGCLRITLGESEVKPVFLHTYLKMARVIEWIQNQAIGATMPNLNTGILRRIPINYPPLPIQRKIAAILSAYDELIENNNRRIAILEKMAEEIYREWFVRLRFPGHEKVKVVKGVPEGWEVKSFSNIADFINGYPFAPVDWKNEGYPIIKIRELKQGVTSDTPRSFGENVPKKMFINNGDILFSWSGSLEVVIWNGGESLLNQHLFKVLPVNPLYHDFIYQALSMALPEFEVLTTGATMKHIKRKELNHVKINFPPIETIKIYNTVVGNCLKKLSLLNTQNTILKSTRDLLLPRLISGKLDVENLDIAFSPGMEVDA